MGTLFRRATIIKKGSVVLLRSVYITGEAPPASETLSP